MVFPARIKHHGLLLPFPFEIYSNDGWLTYNKSYLQLPKSVSDAIERNKDSDSEDFADLTLVFDKADGTPDRCVESGAI